jgi:pimeloyl-ACP methyl ester carboxylesterase
MVQLKQKRAKVNGVNLHYVSVGSGPVVLCLHGWPQNHREFLPFFESCSSSHRFIAPDLRGYADSDKPFADYLPATIAQDMLELADVEAADRFHILSHDLGGPPSVALAYMAGKRASSLATIETPFFGLDFPGYVDPRVPYWHFGLHANMDIARFLIEGREEQYLRHFFRDFAYNPNAMPEAELPAVRDADEATRQSPGESQSLRFSPRKVRAARRIREEETVHPRHGMGRPTVLRVALH